MLFLSGATARETDAEYGDMAAQTDVILKRMKLILEAEGYPGQHRQDNQLRYGD